MLSALIWKDIQVNCVPLRVAILLLVGSFGAFALIGLIEPTFTQQIWGRRFFGVLAAGSLASHITSQLSLAVLAGNMIAAERVDRSAEFLVYLPASRGQVLLSKAILLVSTALVLLLVPSIAIGCALLWGESPSNDFYKMIAVQSAFISTFGFCAAGCGWFASSRLHNNATSILVAIFCPFVLGFALSIFSGEESAQFALYLSANISVGVAGFLWGTRYFLNRIEP